MNLRWLTILTIIIVSVVFYFLNSEMRDYRCAEYYKYDTPSAYGGMADRCYFYKKRNSLEIKKSRLRSLSTGLITAIHFSKGNFNK